VSLLAVRHQRRWSAALERSTFVIQAIPGVVVGLALVYLASRYLGFLYQSPQLLVAAYTLMFFPLALVAVSSSVVRASPRLEEAGRSLGRGPLAVRLTITLPLLAPGLAAAFCFVFLSAATELTATLLLVPTGVQTLAPSSPPPCCWSRPACRPWRASSGPTRSRASPSARRRRMPPR
jgi:iron(III) transport system permease protein